MQVLRHLFYVGGMAALLFYLLNPGAGVFELLPDHLPLVGNLDEAAAIGLLVVLFRRWRAPRVLAEDVEGGAIPVEVGQVSDQGS